MQWKNKKDWLPAWEWQWVLPLHDLHSQWCDNEWPYRFENAIVMYRFKLYGWLNTFSNISCFVNARKFVPMAVCNSALNSKRKWYSFSILFSQQTWHNLSASGNLTKRPVSMRSGNTPSLNWLINDLVYFGMLQLRWLATFMSCLKILYVRNEEALWNKRRLSQA